MGLASIKNNTLTMFISFCMALVVMQNTIGSIPHLATSHTFIITIIALFILTIREIPKLNSTFVLYIFYIGITLLILDPPSIFSPWMRFALFISLLAIASPLIQNFYLRLFRRMCLQIILSICIIISTISFIFFFLGLNFMEYSANLEFTDKGGLFGGLANHSIVLGIVSGIAICTLLYLGLKKNWIWSLLTIPCLGSLLFSASRGALGATLAGVMAILFIAKGKTKNFSKILLLILASIPLMILVANKTSILDGLQSKTLDRGTNALFSSREDKITYRLEEFASSPIIGIGFSSISLHGGDEIDMRSGRIEPGSSWFSLLSMTGIIGTLLFLYILCQCIKTQLNSHFDSHILLLGLVCFFIISMFSEGYIFAAGSPLCFILWLVIGNCIDPRYYNTNTGIYYKH